MVIKKVKSICLAGGLLAGLCMATISHADTNSTQSLISVLKQNTSDEHVVWQREPIAISLPVGKERFVTFPSEVQFGYNVNLLPITTLRVENDNQTLYFKAGQPFDTQRVEAKLSTGEIILIDLSATKDSDDAPIDIVLPKLINHPQLEDIGSNASQANANYVSLARFAVQQLYAPKRLLTNQLDIARFPMETSHVVPLVYDNSIAAMPLASWRGGNLYVTAVLLKNQLNQPLRLDPRLICGDWQAATLYPQNQLAPRGTPINRDTSTLFVVSNRPFGQAIQSCFH